MSDAESLYVGEPIDARKETSPSAELAVVEQQVAEKAEISPVPDSGGISPESEFPAKDIAQKRKRVGDIIVRAQDRVSRTAPPTHEQTKSVEQRRAEWADRRTLEIIEDKLGPRVEDLAKKLKKDGRLDDKQPERQKFQIKRTEKTGAIYDLLDRERYLMVDDDASGKVHYLDPIGFIAAKVLLDPTLSSTDKYLLIGGSRRLAGTFIAKKIAQIKFHNDAE
jgi:hypothetical protein